MKRINEKQMRRYLPKIQKLVEENPVWAGSLAELREINLRNSRGTLTVDDFNHIILSIPLTDILLYRQHGLDFPRKKFNEEIED